MPGPIKLNLELSPIQFWMLYHLVNLSHTGNVATAIEGEMGISHEMWEVADSEGDGGLDLYRQIMRQWKEMGFFQVHHDLNEFLESQGANPIPIENSPSPQPPQPSTPPEYGAF